jgi:thiol-disulfide isomerase/thioredoxin
MELNLTNAALIGLLAWGGWKEWDEHRARPAPVVPYTDVAGGRHALNHAMKPTVVGFWITHCGYSRRMMSVLGRVRGRYGADQVDVVGFELNPMSDAEVASNASNEGYDNGATLAAAQQNEDLIRRLAEGFKIRGPGRDIYVVDRKGRYHAVAAVDWQDHPRDPNSVESDVAARLSDAMMTGF